LAPVEAFQKISKNSSRGEEKAAPANRSGLCDQTASLQFGQSFGGGTSARSSNPGFRRFGG
jgi:hypothetical protein